METPNSRSVRDQAMSHNDLETYVPYEWTSGGHCVVCGLPFSGPHLLSAKTCGDACRKRLQRLRQKEKQAWLRAMTELQTIRAGIKRKERIPEFIGELNRLRGEIDDLLHLAGDESEKSRR